MSRSKCRLIVVAAGAATAVVMLPLAASAHVTVNAPGAQQGGFTVLTFRVPTERDVPTTKLAVNFPANAPLAFASIKPHVGWTYKVEHSKPAKPIESEGGAVDSVVSKIIWTAQDGGIKPGEFDEFEVSAGPLPEVDTMTFKALQTYEDGEVVRWIEASSEGGPEPEHPAPVLHLDAAGGEETPEPTASASTSVPSPTVSASPAAVADDDADDEDSDDTLAIIAIAVGGVALLIAVIALVRARRTRA